MKTLDLSTLFEATTSYPVLTKDADGGNAWVDYGLGKHICQEELHEIGPFNMLDEWDAERILNNIEPQDRVSVERGTAYANADQTFIAVLYGDYYQVIRKYDGGSEEVCEICDSKEKALKVLEDEAKRIAENYDYIRKEWLEDAAELDFPITHSLDQGAEPWARNYQTIKDNFTPGLWQTDWQYEPELLYAKGNDTLRWDNWKLIIEIN